MTGLSGCCLPEAAALAGFEPLASPAAVDGSRWESFFFTGLPEACSTGGVEWRALQVRMWWCHIVQIPVPSSLLLHAVITLPIDLF